MRASLENSLIALSAVACATLFVACAVSANAADYGGTGGGSFNDASASGSFGTGGGFGTGSGSVGSGADLPGTPYYNGSYSYLCGGSNAKCTPGTSDCAPGGNPNMSTGSAGSTVACQIIPTADGITADCEMVGTYGVGDPCENVAHCAAGLGCVTNMGGGICRQYCCGDVESCPADTYCAPIRMAETAKSIPVCTPVTKCQLLDDSICKPGQVCTIVRDDGTTSCIDVGPGKAGDQCPCADGYVCSKINNTCLKLCHIGNDAADCAGGTCQGGVAGYPQGIGICVGYK